MSYFSDNYSYIRYPLGIPGLRLAQAGAVHSIAGHFSVSNEAGLVVMPTGSGKTAVLLVAPFVLQATRVLIITPSQLVRGQIAEGAKQLAILKEAGVLPDTVALPRVAEVKSLLATDGDWEALREFDFVVATPNCTSPGIEGVAPAPVDIFDVVLIDEAHHIAAKTWSALLDHFPTAKRILFTATPYRRDRKLIKARSIYTYPLKKAFEDKIFGKVNFVPVQPQNGQKSDTAIALKAAELFQKDRTDGLSHVIMVRTDSKKRADELREVYAQNTNLKLQVVHSGHTAAFVKKTIERLKHGLPRATGDANDTALDGVICVNMMGEGFDFPYLKIAAVHTPHQSLAVTLQFIGRFARTSVPGIGDAQFVAVPDEIAGEAEELFHEGAIWNEIVPNLSEARVTHEQHAREVIGSFKKKKIYHEEDEDLEFDLGSIKPFCHVKVYSVDDFSGFETQPPLSGSFEIVQYDVSDEHRCSILLLKEQIRPRWTDYEELSKVTYDFILTYYDETSGHLFICSSRRDSLSLYDAVGKHYSCDTHRVLPLFEINRVLHNLEQPQLFQVGMKNSVTSSNSESYQTKMGADLKGAISDTDGKLYHRGHLYLGALENGKPVNIGYSSGSKVWSNSSVRVPEIIEWCKNLAKKLTQTNKVLTRTTIDFLDVGEPLVALPDDVIALSWNDDVYKNSVEVNAPATDSFQLHDMSVEKINCAQGKLDVRISLNNFSTDLRLEVKNGLMVCTSSTDLNSVTVTRKGESFPLLTYLKEYQFHIYLSDFSRASGGALFRSNPAGYQFSPDCIKAENWKAQNVDITKEFATPGQTGVDNSIQGLLKKTLPLETSQVVIYDHGSGEIGDFLTLQEDAAEIKFSLYHCKGSGGADPGERVGDVYEVAGQVVKSLIWLRKAEDLEEKIYRRLDQGSGFLKGDKRTLREIFSRTVTKALSFTIYCVQPGLSAGNLSDKLTGPMAAARDYVKRSCRGNVIFWISP